MNIKVFNIRLSKDHCNSDQEKMNSFLNNVDVKLTSTNFVTTGTVDYWSAVVFFEPKKNTSSKQEPKFSEVDLLPDEIIKFKALRHWRNDLAEKLGWSSFRICHNSHLISIAKVNPKTIEELGAISNFGNIRTEKYGDDIISLLNAL
jgi:ribonuclease D